MNASEIVMDELKDVAVQIPSIIAILVGSVFAVVRWNRHPRVSLVVLIGLLLLLIHEFAFAVIFASVPRVIATSTNEMTRATVSHNVYIALAVIYNCLEAVPFVLLLVAIFMSRRNTETAPA